MHKISRPYTYAADITPRGIPLPGMFSSYITFSVLTSATCHLISTSYDFKAQCFQNVALWHNAFVKSCRLKCVQSKDGRDRQSVYDKVKQADSLVNRIKSQDTARNSQSVSNLCSSQSFAWKRRFLKWRYETRLLDFSGVSAVIKTICMCVTNNPI